jgi:hypothetical protein
VEVLKERPFGVNIDVNIKTDRKKTGCEVVNRIKLAQLCAKLGDGMVGS